MFKLTSVILIIFSMVVVGCGVQKEYIKIPQSKIMLPPVPQMEEDQFQYQILKQGKSYVAEQGGAIVFPRANYEFFKVHLKQIQLWMQAVTKIADKHNEYADKIMEENAKKGKGWFW